MDIRKVKKLIEMLEASELEEIEIQEGEESVRLVKKQSHTVVSDGSSTKENLTSVQSPTDHEPSSKEPVEAEGDTITSPMVGTFYAASSPGAKPFISIGDEIMEGEVVCIVEAMKMMNEITSDFSGIVTAILVENSEPVEFGQSLFRIA